MYSCAKTSYVEYVNQKFGISVELPKGWTKEASYRLPNNVVIKVDNKNLLGNKKATIVIIEERHLAGQADVSKVSKKHSSELSREFESCKIISEMHRYINGIEAYETQYLTTINSYEVRQKVVVLSRRRTFSIMCTAKSKYYLSMLPIFEKTIESFKIFD